VQHERHGRRARRTHQIARARTNERIPLLTPDRDLPSSRCSLLTRADYF
jgi:hypothetical protein